MKHDNQPNLISIDAAVLTAVSPHLLPSQTNEIHIPLVPAVICQSLPFQHLTEINLSDFHDKIDGVYVSSPPDYQTFE